MAHRSHSSRSAVSSLTSSSAISLRQLQATSSTNSQYGANTTRMNAGAATIGPAVSNPHLPANSGASVAPGTATPTSSTPITASSSQQPTSTSATATGAHHATPNSETGTANVRPTIIPVSSTHSVRSTPPPPTSNAGSSKQNVTVFNRYFDNWWAWEISAGILSIICLATVVIVLAFFNGKPQPELRWGITLNALIALIVTVMKGASLTPLMEGMSQLKWIVFARETRPLMDFNVYDGASRGGLNAMTLLWHMRHRLWREATALAALFYFISLGVDTFAQQLIQTEFRDANITSAALVSLERAQRYDSYLQLPQNLESILPDGPDSDMIAAIYTPLYSTKLTDQSDLFECPDGNCTYPIVPSVAVCGQCHDLASSVNKTTWEGVDVLSLPQGPEVSTIVAMNVTSTITPAKTNSFTDKVALIVSFAYIYFNNTATYVNGTYIDTPIRAGECALFPCVQEYQTTVRRSVLNQSVVREWSHVEPRRITNSTTDALGQWDYYDDIKIPTPGMEGECAEIGFNMSIKAFLALQNATAPLLQGNAIMGSSGGTLYGVLPSSVIIQRMYATDNMTEFIERVATTITSSIRRHPADYVMPDHANPPTTDQELYELKLIQPKLPGQATRQLPFVRIEWPWIVLPAINVVFSNLFLIFAMAKTKRAQKIVDIGVWKSSSLPILYHGLDAAALTRANVNPAISNKVAYMEDNASQLVVKLNVGGNGIKLS